MHIGRYEEKRMIDNLILNKSGGACLIGVKGVRRVGKTYFVNNYVNSLDVEVVYFNFIGSNKSTTEENFENLKSNIISKLYDIKSFLISEEIYESYKNRFKEAKDWLMVFNGLSSLFKEIEKKDPVIKIVLFLDEICWFSKKEKFISQFQQSWNLNLINNDNLICFLAGSKISWMNDKLFKNTQEFYGRIDLEIELEAFSLIEIAKYLISKGKTNIKEIINYYLMFGGIIKYYQYLDLTKDYEFNIKNLLINKKYIKLLTQEKEILFDSLFSKKRNHQELMKELSSKKSCLFEDFKLDGAKSTLYADLNELIENGMLVLDGKVKTRTYSLNSNFAYFYFYWIESGKYKTFNFDNADYNQWKGSALEIAVFNQIHLILDLDNIEKILDVTTSFQKKKQIDLLIKYKFNNFIIECKNYKEMWNIGMSEYQDLIEKISSLNQPETKLYIITVNGAKFVNNIQDVDFRFVDLTKWLENKI